MTIRLIKYETARIALKEASQIDEVKDIRDKAQALAAYARQARNDDMIRWATEIKLRAERRAGEMLAETPRNNGARGVGASAVVADDSTPPKLNDIGLTRDQSSKFQAIASIPEEKFEEAIAKPKTTTTSLVKSSRKKKEAKEKNPKAAPKAPKADKPDEWKAKYETLAEDYAELKDNRDSLAEEVKTCDHVCTQKDAKEEMLKLREQLKMCTRRRDELMANAVELRKQCKWWEGQARKNGYKGKSNGART